MKTLKTLAFAAAVCLAFNVSAQQGKMDPQQMAQKQTDNIKQHVTGVTSDQESKILAIEQDFSKSAQDARAASNGDKDAMRAKMQPLRQDRDAKIKAVLSDSQYAEYTQLEKEHQGGGRKGGQ